MKKLSAIVLVVALLLVSVSPAFTVSAATSGECGDCTWELDGTTLTISGDGFMDSYNLSWYILPPWYGQTITKLIIEPGVMSIGSCAFKDCTGLTAVTLPDGLHWVEEEAFSGCTALADVTMLDELWDVGREAFDGTPWLEAQPDGVIYIGTLAYTRKGRCPATVTLKEGTTAICDYAFSGSTTLQHIDLPESLESIGCGAFQNCTALTEIHIPDDIYMLPGMTFNGCTALKEVTGCAGVWSIGEETFTNCKNLTGYSVSENLIDIGMYAFSSCTSLKEFPLPSRLECINEGAFKNCASLKSISVPDTVTFIGGSAFEGCTSLADISVPDGILDIQEHAFHNTAWYNDYPDGALYLGDMLYGCKGESPTSLTIKDGTLGICDYAFAPWQDLKTVDFPDSLIHIGSTAFDNTAWLEDQPDGVVYAGKIAYALKGDCPASLSFREGTKVIDEYAFFFCDELRSVTFPAGLTSIGFSAFTYCESLTDITLPEGLTRLDTAAFSFCTNLSRVNIPASVTEIAWDTFYESDKVTLYGYSGSYAQAYARENDIPFVSVGSVAARGDCNADGIIDTTDLLLMKKCLAGLTEESDCAAGIDANHDGTVDTTDLLLLKKYLAGLVDTL